MPATNEEAVDEAIVSLGGLGGPGEERRQRRHQHRAQSLGAVLDAREKSRGSTSGNSNNNHRPFYRSQSRKIFFSGDHLGLILPEPEIREVVTSSHGDVAAEEADEDGVAVEAGDVRKKRKGIHYFITNHKLERGTLSAFRREARNIMRRDLPYLTHKDNIIKIFTDKGQAQIVAAATKSGSALWRSCQRLELRFKYYFQHPYLRLFVCYVVILCNLLMFAEDPVSHSKREANIPVLGNVFSFMFTKCPPDWRWALFKVSMWLLAIACGLVVGKTLIHGIFLSRFLRLKMFRADQGSWMVQFFTVIVSLFLFSHAYNVLLVLILNQSKNFMVDSRMSLSSSTVMKCAACGTWLGTLITALIVTDMMLQDNLYPSFAPSLRVFWRSHSKLRIWSFWISSIVATAIAITIITTDWIIWDRLNRDFFATTELSRAFLASSILVMDLVIVMQDWDFPHFTNTLDINLPGYNKHTVSFQTVEIEISGKWFNYGIIFLVMLFDLNMWKNQIFYHPSAYGQYSGVHNRVHTVTNETILATDDAVLWTYEARSQINPQTKLPYINEDMAMHSRFLGYSMWIKSMAFIPCLVGFVVFFITIATYGRISRDSAAGAAGEAEGDNAEVI